MTDAVLPDTLHAVSSETVPSTAAWRCPSFKGSWLKAARRVGSSLSKSVMSVHSGSPQPVLGPSFLQILFGSPGWCLGMASTSGMHVTLCERLAGFN